MVNSLGDICNSIAISGLPVHLMGARQMLRNLEYPKTMQEAELIEDMAEFMEFELTAHMTPCRTTFFIVTTYRKNEARKHVIYGIFPRYQSRPQSTVNEKLDRSSKQKRRK